METKIRIAFDITHKEIMKIGKLGEHEWESWTNVEKLIREKGYDPIILQNSPISSSDLSQINILIIGAPQTKFSDNEISTIVEFIKNGGSLLVINEHGGDLHNNTNLSEITKPFGIKFNNDMVHDKVHNIKGYDYGPIISNFEVCSSLTFNIREFNLLLGCSLTVSDKASVVARSSKDSYSRVRTSLHKWVQKEGASLPILAVYKSSNEEGRVVAIGDTHLFSDDDAGMPLYNNRLLFNNIIDWLSEPFLDAEEKFTILSNKINKISDDMVVIKKKLGLIETGNSIYRPGKYLPDEIVARVDKLESKIKTTDEKIGKEEIRYYKTRIRLEIWAIIISLLAVVISIFIGLFVSPIP